MGFGVRREKPNPIYNWVKPDFANDNWVWIFNGNSIITLHFIKVWQTKPNYPIYPPNFATERKKIKKIKKIYMYV